MLTIQRLLGREVYDSRGLPTVEAEMWLSDGSWGRGMVPSGASTGVHEAWELRDTTSSRLGGRGVRQAVQQIELLARLLQGKSAEQSAVDELMIQEDGTPNKSRLGANALLAVSISLAHALAQSKQQPLWQHFRSYLPVDAPPAALPVPLVNVLNGGRHAEGASDFQEYMLVPHGAASFRQAMEMGAGTFQKLKQILHDRHLGTTVGDEGGFAPPLGGNEQPLQLLLQAIEQAGYRPGVDIALAVDVAASEFYHDGNYVLTSQKQTKTPAEMTQLYVELCQRYPIFSIEDPFEQDAWQEYQHFTQAYGNQVQVVGDDLFVTNVSRLQQGIQKHAANAILVKLNQIGTITETWRTVQLAKQNGYEVIISHRSGETEDTTIADLVVGWNCSQIKTGSMSRSERIAKYNRLLRIEDGLGTQAQFAHLARFT